MQAEKRIYGEFYHTPQILGIQKILSYVLNRSTYHKTMSCKLNRGKTEKSITHTRLTEKYPHVRAKQKQTIL